MAGIRASGGGQTSAGYSGTPLPRKLGIGPGTCLRLVGAPDGFESILGELPEGAKVARRGREDAALWMWFVRTRADLEREIVRMAGGFTAGALWIAWPKKTSTLASDVSESEVRAAGLAHGLVDYKICAVDSTWSALKFARRRPEAAKGKARGR